MNGPPLLTSNDASARCNPVGERKVCQVRFHPA